MNRVVPTFETNESSPDAQSGFGALESTKGRFPLIGMDVKSTITGLVAKTRLSQQFRNPLDESLEATYIFPLPDRAAVTSFRMTVGDRTIEGILKERSKARREYNDAIQEGYQAAIAEEERSGVFTMRVGNLPPKSTATVEIELEGFIESCDGEATYRFPLVVAPRYTPGIPLDGESVGSGTASDTDQVPDASRVTPPVLLPGFPNPIQLSLEVQLDLNHELMASVGWADRVRSSLHSTIREDGHPLTVRLVPGERLNRDFLLRFNFADSNLSSSLQFCRSTDEKPGVFALTLVPPQNELDDTRPRQVVFVLDRSGSMSGWKIVAARRAMGRMIDTLLDDDQFCVLAFDNLVESSSTGHNRLEKATNRAKWKALEWLGSVSARGGTEMGSALQQALSVLSGIDDLQEATVVLVTDGQITGEDALLRSLQKTADGRLPRICAVGIDQAVNAGFLNRLTQMGRGRCELVESEDRLDDALHQIHHMIRRPIVEQLQLEPLNFDLVSQSVVPARLPDLFPGSPVTIFGRHLSTESVPQLRITGVQAANSVWEQEISGQRMEDGSFLSMWGRTKVRELEDQYASAESDYSRQLDLTDLNEEIVQTSLETGVLSRFTAFVAVDRSATVSRGEPVEIVQPVELPAGWEDAVTLRQCSLRTTFDCADEEDNLSAMFGDSPPQSRRRSPAPSVRLPQVVQEIRDTLSSLESCEESSLLPLVEKLRDELILLERLLDSASDLRRECKILAQEYSELVERFYGCCGTASRSEREMKAHLRMMGRLKSRTIELLKSIDGGGPKKKRRLAFWK